MFRGINTLFRDIMLLLSASLLAILILILPWINESNKKELDDEEIKSPGNMIVEIYWDNSRNIDIDLWIKTPKDDKPVSYSRKDGALFSLLRDDLGSANDTSGINSEIAFTRGVFPGEYIMNIHYYRNNDAGLNDEPLEVTMRVTLRDGGRPTYIYYGINIMRFPGDEYTAVRFRLDSEGKWLFNSNNSIQIKLRG